MTFVCGTGGGGLPNPGDPDNNSVLTATPAFGGVEVSWTYPGVNPQAVAHTRLYRGLSDTFASAFQIATVEGDRFYDRQDNDTRWYYWIRFVSIFGTEGELIGPASAVARPLIEDLIEQLTGRIDEGVLAHSLQTELGKITLNRNDLLNEIANRVSGNAALSSALSDLQNGLVDAVGLISLETTNRTSGDSALVSQINLLAAANDELAALVETEHLAWVTADNALAEQIDLVAVASSDAAAAVTDIEQSKIGYSATNDEYQTPYDGDGETIVYPAELFPTIDYPQYVDRTRIIDKVGVDRWNATPAGGDLPLIWVKGMPLASAVKRVAVTDESGGSASLEQAFIAQKTLNDGFRGMYTAKITVDGLVGGFGIYNDGDVVEAGFDVDLFWVGRTDEDKRKPFIIEGGEVFIDEAAINKLTFSKLRDEAGTFIVEDGRIVGDYIQVNTASIENAAITTAKIDNLAVTTAKINDLAVTNAKIQNAAVETLTIKGDAVTVPITSSRQAVVAGAGVNTSNWAASTWLTIAKGYITLDQSGVVYAQCICAQAYGYGMRKWGMQLFIGGREFPIVGGEVVEVAPVVAGSHGLPAGTHLVEVKWAGQDDKIKIYSTELLIMGVKR